MMLEIHSQTLEELEQQFKEWQQPSYRVTQLLNWLYVRNVEGWAEMSNLPKALRTQLEQTYLFDHMELVRKQGEEESTQKFLWRLSDGALIECVLIPANPALYGEDSDRHTLCVSTQVGCAYGCKFCASGLNGFKRNLRPDEIIGQVLTTQRWLQKNGKSSDKPEEADPMSSDRMIHNLVIMGMGEPLSNYDNLFKALKILNAPWGGKIGARKITISTSGLAPQIRRLAEEPYQFRLAVSLHGATDAIRDRIMPVNKKYPLAELIAACEYYQEKKGRMITLEYILIQGVNDGLDQAVLLARLAKRLHAKVNLIAYNTVEGLPWGRPSEEVQDAFQKAVERERVVVTSRREKGNGIDAACGQLRLKTEQISELVKPQ